MVLQLCGLFWCSVFGVLFLCVVDNLFWMGCYVEWVEIIVCILCVCYVCIFESGCGVELLQEVMDVLLDEYGIDFVCVVLQGLIDIIVLVVNSVGQVCDRFLIDGWLVLIDLEKFVCCMVGCVIVGDDVVCVLLVLLCKLVGFLGLVYENMYCFFGWCFLIIGWMQECVFGMIGIVVVFVDFKVFDGVLDLCVELGDSVLIYWWCFSVLILCEMVIDLLVLDLMNLCLVCNQLDYMLVQIEQLFGVVWYGEYFLLGCVMLWVVIEVVIEFVEMLDMVVL